MQTAEKFADAGITDLVALRGDPSKGDTTFTPHPDGFKDSCALITTLAKPHRFNIRVGACPDVHPDAASAKQNIDWLKTKIDARACEALTQLFFDAKVFLRFRNAFEKTIRDSRTDLLSVAQCTELCDDLMSEGVNDLHFYTLNRPDLARDVCHALGVTQTCNIRNIA